MPMFKRSLIYPNPTGTEFSLKADLEGPVFVQIFDMNGREVYQRILNAIKGSELRFQHKLNSGQYLLRAASKEKIISEKLLIK